jgi:hypothetical protein
MDEPIITHEISNSNRQDTSMTSDRYVTHADAIPAKTTQEHIFIIWSERTKCYDEVYYHCTILRCFTSYVKTLGKKLEIMIRKM